MPDTVRETFDELRQHLKWDITRMLEHKDAGNYSIAVTVAIGSEALSRLQGFRVEKMFTDLMTKHGLTPEMAGDVFGALRNGVAHRYDTGFIQSGPLRIELIVSRGALKHASVRRKPSALVLNVETMWEDLKQVMEKLREALPPGGTLPAAWLADRVQHGDDRAIAAWQKWIETAEEAQRR
jgi:hypothetical protein